MRPISAAICVKCSRSSTPIVPPQAPGPRVIADVDDGCSNTLRIMRGSSRRGGRDPPGGPAVREAPPSHRGKMTASRDEARGVRAAVPVRDRLAPDVVLIARTRTHGVVPAASRRPRCRAAGQGAPALGQAHTPGGWRTRAKPARCRRSAPARPGHLPCPAPVRMGAACQRYHRRQPQESPLYRAVRAHLDAFLARTPGEGGGPLPGFVRRELEAYLRRGLLTYGCLHVRCDRCGDDMVVAFSCKGRGFCPPVGAAA
jgi:hypothetical protein